MARVAAYHTNSPEYPPAHRNVFHDHDDVQPAGTSSLNIGCRNGEPTAVQRLQEAWLTCSKKSRSITPRRSDGSQGACPLKELE